MQAVLALDLGTGSCKGALYSASGERVAIASHPYPLHSPLPGFAEQAPGDYVRASQLVSAILARPGIEVAAVSFSTQTPTLLFCDGELKPLCPAMVWQDSRAAAEAALLESSYSREQRRGWFGMDLPISAASTPAKLLWMSRHRPETWERTRQVFQPKDFIAALMTGVAATDAWCAKGIANVETGATHPHYLALLGKAEEPCPPIRPADAAVGFVTEDAAPQWSLPKGIPVMTGWSDALAGILSTGACHRPRTGFVITGTSEIIGMSRAEGPTHPGVFRVPSHVLPVPGLDLHFGPTQAGGAAVDWLAGVLGRDTGAVLDLVPSKFGPSSIVFRPHLAGERAPYWDHSLTASFAGLRLHHTAADIALAVLQGIALQERLVLGCAEAGQEANEVVLAGGGARDARWNQLRANILQRPVRAMRDTEASLRGAALIGWAGLGRADLRHSPEEWFLADSLEPAPDWAQPARELADRFVVRPL